MLSYQQHPKDTFLLEGENVMFEIVKGTVLATTKRSETQLHSTPGTENTPAMVHSTVALCHEFWVKIETGHEVPVQLRGHDIPIREGHMVTVTKAKKENQNDYVWVSLVNHQSNQFYLLDSKKLLKNHQPQINKICFLLAFLTSISIILYMAKMILDAGGSLPSEPSKWLMFIPIFFYLIILSLPLWGFFILFSLIPKAIFITPKQEREHQKLIQYLQR
jgi:hypothetical protein